MGRLAYIGVDTLTEACTTLLVVVMIASGDVTPCIIVRYGRTTSLDINNSLTPAYAISNVDR